jgi:hypothetical protein
MNASKTCADRNTKGIISIHQDPLGKAATYFQPSSQPAPVSGQLYPYWAGPLSDGVVIGLVAANGAATLSANFADVPGLGAGTYSWTEMYSGQIGTGTGVSISLTAHDMAVYKVTVTGKSSASARTSSTTSTAGTPSVASTTRSTTKAPTTSFQYSTSTTASSTTTIRTTITAATTSSSAATTSTTPPSTTAGAGAAQSHWGQCGGIGYSGAPAVSFQSP